MKKRIFEIIKNFTEFTYRKFIYEKINEKFRVQILNQFQTIAKREYFKSKVDFFLANGYVIFDEYFKDFLPDMRQDFDSILQNPCEEDGEINSTILPGKYIYQSIIFSKIGLDKFVLNVISYYWGKKITLAQTHGLRIEPANKENAANLVENSASIWHNDGKGKQVKMFVLLTDVTELDQGTEIIPNTHKMFHWKKSGNNGKYSSLLTDQEASHFGKPVQICAKAGSAVIFDTNAIHRASRKENGRTRDAWIYYYTNSRNLFDIPFNLEATKSFDKYQKEVARINDL